MSAQNEGYLLLVRGSDWTRGLSADEIQRDSGQVMDWFKQLMESGKAVGGRPLGNEGKLVSGKNGRTVTDGPFAESKEAIAGYFMLKVDTMEEAVAIAQQCPNLAYGITLEVRPLLDRCPHMEQFATEGELATVGA